MKLFEITAELDLYRMMLRCELLIKVSGKKKKRDEEMITCLHREKANVKHLDIKNAIHFIREVAASQ